MSCRVPARRAWQNRRKSALCSFASSPLSSWSGSRLLPAPASERGTVFHSPDSSPNGVGSSLHAPAATFRSNFFNLHGGWKVTHLPSRNLQGVPPRLGLPSRVSRLSASVIQGPGRGVTQASEARPGACREGTPCGRRVTGDGPHEGGMRDARRWGGQGKRNRRARGCVLRPKGPQDRLKQSGVSTGDAAGIRREA